MLNIDRRKNETNQALHEAIDQLHLAKILLQGVYDSRYLLNSDELLTIKLYLDEVNHELCGLDVIHSNFGAIELKSYMNKRVSPEELNRPVEDVKKIPVPPMRDAAQDENSGN